MRWHIALLEPRAAGLTEDDDGEWTSKPQRFLRGRGYEVYYPALPKAVNKSYGVIHMVMRPMFRGYLFVRESARGWEPLRTTPGVRQVNSLLMVENRYAVLPEGEIERIVEKEQQLIHQILNPPPRELPYGVGDTVRVIAGVFSAVQNPYAKIEELDDEERIALLMDIFGRPTRVYASHQQLSPI